MSEEKIKNNFLFSVPSGEPISLEPFHYCFIGQTQFSGKTTLAKRLSIWASELGYKVLIFDTKETEADYLGFGTEVPVCLRESTDSFVLIGLLESMFRRRLTPYYATLSRLSEGAKGFDDIIIRAKELEGKTKSGWLKDACRILYDLLERLKTETSKVKTVPKLQLQEGINRMDINQFSLEAQQLIVKNSFEDALRVYKRNLIVVVDEAFKFIPQGYSSASTRAIMNFMTQGAKTGLFGWIATQFLAVTDKDPLKACAIKFLGTQDHITEVKHTLDLIPEVRGKFGSDDIMRLKLGHWILVRKNPPDVRIVYATPVGVPENVGRRVALGELSSEFVRDNYLKKIKGDDDELVWKEKYRELEVECEKQRESFETWKKMLEEDMEKRVQEASKKAMETVEEIKKTMNVEEYRETIAKLKDKTSQLEDKIIELKESEKGYQANEEILNKLREDLGLLLPKTILPIGGGAPQGVKVTVGLEHRELDVTISHAEKQVNMTTDTVNGKILYCAINNLPKEGFSEGELSDALKEHGWNIGHSTLAPQLANLAKDGFLVKLETRPTRYRLPLKLKINVAK